MFRKHLTYLLIALTAAAVSAEVEIADATAADMERHQHGRRLGGYSGEFCARSLNDCCGEAENEDGEYPDCKCPKRRKGGLDKPICFWGFCSGSYGGDDGICAKCTQKCGVGGELEGQC